MRTSNPGRPIPASSVLGFASIAAANAFLLANPERAPAGVHFLVGDNAPGAVAGAAAAGINYVLQVNATVKYFKGRFQDPTFFAAVPLQAAADREVARFQWAAAGRAGALEWGLSASQFAHPATDNINLVGQAMGPFVFAANMFNFVMLVRRRLRRVVPAVAAPGGAECGWRALAGASGTASPSTAAPRSCYHHHQRDARSL
jgi:hypothetical protein